MARQKAKMLGNVDVRNRILEAAVGVFAKKTCLSFSISDIAQAADVEPSLLYYYFKDKHDLIEEVFFYNYQIISDLLNSVMLSEEDTDEIIFKKMLRVVYGYGLENPCQISVSKQFMLLNYLDKPMDKLCRRIHQPNPNRLLVFISNLSGKSRVVTSVGTHATLFCYMPLLDFILYIDDYPLEKREAAADSFINALWNSIAQ